MKKTLLIMGAMAVVSVVTIPGCLDRDVKETCHTETYTRCDRETDLHSKESAGTSHIKPMQLPLLAP